MIRPIRENELEESRRICFTAFESAIDGASCAAESAKRMISNPVTRMKRDYQNTLAWFDGSDTMQACVSHCICPVEFDGNSASMAAVGDVAAMPCCRGKGVMRALFASMLKDWHQRGILFSYLYPFSGTYYNQFGYSYCVRQKQWNFPVSKLPDYRVSGTIELYEPRRLDDLKTIYQAFTSGLNLSVKREEIEWYHAAGQYQADRDFRFIYLYYSEAGIPCGYLIYTNQREGHRRIMKCSEFAFADTEGLKGLISFCRSKGAYFDNVAIPLPDFIPMDFICPEFHLPSGGEISVLQTMHGMVRAVNVHEVLKAARYTGNGDFRLFLTDSQLPANEGLWLLKWKEGRAVSIEHDTQWKEGDNTQADAVINIDLFSRLICRGITETEAAYLPDGCKRCSNDILLQVFPAKKSGVLDYF